MLARAFRFSPLFWASYGFYSLRFPQMPPFERKLLSAGTCIRNAQHKHIINDYILRKKHKIVRCGSEFGPELKWFVPFAHWHHRNGTLLGTASCEDTRDLYFFSPSHEEKSGPRRAWVDPEVPN